MIVTILLDAIPDAAGSPFRFQLLAVILLGLVFILTVAATAFRKITRREGIWWSLVWLAAAGAILRPDLMMGLARKLGIGRGADLVLYGSVCVMLLGFMMTYVRLRRLRREITLVVRHLALKEVQDSKNG